MKKLLIVIIAVSSISFLSSCGGNKENNDENNDSTVTMKEKVDQYAVVELSADLSHLSNNDKKIISIMLDVAQIMDDLYWKQTLGDKNGFLDTISDPDMKRFAEINYGPWDRLDGNKPFVPGFDTKPAGANFYPTDMTKEEFEAYEDENKASLYTVIRRDEDGNLKTIWYHDEYAAELKKASELLLQAAELAEDAGLKLYLTLRAEALLTSNYQPSDLAWMDMKESNIDFVVGPIENYEDALYGYKAAFESFILIKDVEWSNQLAHFAALLPELQTKLPVEDKYKAEKPGADSDMNVYEVVYYGGDCNAGSKTIAINLPNDEEVQLQKGTRKLQLKNAMKAKFDKILYPIAEILMDPDQLQYVKFDAFFQNVMFHETAHGMGIKNTINGKGTVREALQEFYSPIEEGKADILGLYLVTLLRESGEITDGDLKENYVSFIAGIFRSVRFGVASAHGKANMMCFRHMMNEGAISRSDKGFYTVNFEKMPAAVESLANKILVIQGDGDIEAAKKWIETDGKVSDELQKDLDRLTENKIPVDIVYSQGKSHLNL
ncbi:MAG: Zn-dependent hydrolase [Bacteroidales bacterium]|nr:Zn-dependent hydrolase [Bacteroidales bacterium]